ncbi:MAG: hypothetical protein IPL46_30535 [Saprospiraceae bacterium]|nr:hypothetical protein [Saprospiraceae bacterium]
MGCLIKLASLDDRSKSEAVSGSIIGKPDQLNYYHNLFALLKTIKYPIKFLNFVPFSLFTYEVDYQGGNFEFIFQMEFKVPTLCFAVGKLAFVVALNDAGSIRKHLTVDYLHKQKKIYVPQLLDFFARVSTLYTLRIPQGSYLISHLKNTQPRMSLIPNPNSEKQDLFEEWDHTRYIYFLESYIGNIGGRVVEGPNSSVRIDYNTLTM